MNLRYSIYTHTLHPEAPKRFHAGNAYLILLVNSENCICTLDGNGHVCTASDMLLIKPRHEALLCTQKPQASCQITSVRIPVETLRELSDETCDLVEKYQFAPYDVSIIHSEIEQCLLIKNMIAKLRASGTEDNLPGTALYQKSLFSFFLVLFLRSCVQSDQVHQSHQKKHLIMDDVFRYISHHLDGDLSLLALEKEFYISGSHLSREFKKSAGITLHAYINRARVDLAKKYLIEGRSAHEVWPLCGFGSYSNFFKVFKEESGMTPMEYYRRIT